MRTAINVLADELRRLKAHGVKTLRVSPESVAALRRAMKSRRLRRTPGGPGDRVAAETTFERNSEKTPPAVTELPPAPAWTPRVTLPEAARPPAAPLPPPVPFVMPEGDKPARMAALRDRVLGDPVCSAHVRPGKKIVVGVGSLDAKIMFVGEAPGADEEIQGEPFVGPAGQLLTRMIGGMGLKREEVYIGNIMNWRPAMPLNASGVQYGNRPPTEEEMRYCLPYLRAQVEIVSPDLLVALGATAAQGLLGFGTFKALGEVRGRWREFGGKPLMVTYHPSYILRNQSNRSKRMIWEDLLQVMERAGLPVSDRQRGYFL